MDGARGGRVRGGRGPRRRPYHGFVVGTDLQRRPGRCGPRLPSRLAAAVMLGIATLFTSKPERDMHWSIPPNFEVLHLRAVQTGQGDPPDVP